MPASSRTSPAVPQPPSSAEVLRLLLAERPYLMALLVSLVRDLGLAEELFRDVCVAACGAERPAVTGPAFGSWVRELARRRGLAALRARSQSGGAVPSAELVDEIERAIAALAGEPGAAWARRKEALRARLASLPAHLREVLEGRYAHDQNAAQIAARLDRQAQAVAAELARARDLLAAAWSGTAGEAHP